MKNDKALLIRLPEEIKKTFKEKCDRELIDMSVKIRMLIYQDLNKK